MATRIHAGIKFFREDATGSVLKHVYSSQLDQKASLMDNQQILDYTRFVGYDGKISYIQ
jgi:hypothetical protein